MYSKILILTFLLFVIGICSTVNGTCTLTRNEIENTKAIFTYKQDNQQYPLRVETVPVETTLYMVCTNQDQVVTTMCLDAGNWDLPFPHSYCQMPMRATVELINDPVCPGMMYRVGYDYDASFLELYRSCFDKANARAKFTIHSAWDYSVVTSRPDQVFTTDHLISSADADSYKITSIYNRFIALYGADQPYIRSTSDAIIDIGHLVPSGDFLFVNNMRATFKFINAVPKFNTINRGNWKAIENWVRNRVSHTGRSLIITGALDVLILPDMQGRLIPAYLSAPNRNPIPKWIYKLIIDKVGRVVFLTYNDVYEIRMPTPPCQTVSCPDTINLSPLPASGLTVCCNPVHFQNYVVPEIRDF